MRRPHPDILPPPFYVFRLDVPAGEAIRSAVNRHRAGTPLYWPRGGAALTVRCDYPAHAIAYGNQGRRHCLLEVHYT